MRYRNWLLSLGVSFLIGGWSNSHANSDPVTNDATSIGIITRPKTEAPQCVNPVRPKRGNDTDIGIITKPKTEAPHCVDLVQPVPRGADVVVPRTTPEEGELEKGSSRCPIGMVPVGDTTCLDRFEASRPDATDVSMGTDSSKATTRAGVLPWFPVDITTARAACTAAGKRLCKEDEIRYAFRGPANTTYPYPYGNTYAPKTCNGIDTYCNCDSASCAGVQPCPYPGWYDRDPAGVIGKGCGADLGVTPTGSFPGCVNA